MKIKRADQILPEVYGTTLSDPQGYNFVEIKNESEIVV